MLCPSGFNLGEKGLQGVKSSTPFLIFGVGLAVCIGGIILALSFPAVDPWKLSSETLASEKLLEVSPASTSQTAVLTKEELISTAPLWQSKNDSLIDETITVPSWEAYESGIGYTPFIYYEVTDFVITGTADEQSSPQQRFNFYVFDPHSFGRWKDGWPSEAFHEVQGQTSISFSFSIDTQDWIPGHFYFVIEEYVAGVKPTVVVSSTVDWKREKSKV